MAQLSLHSSLQEERKETSSWKAPCRWMRFSLKVPAMCQTKRSREEWGGSSQAQRCGGFPVPSWQSLQSPQSSARPWREREIWESRLEPHFIQTHTEHWERKPSSTSQFGFAQKNYNSQKPLTVVFLTSQTDGLEIVFTVYFLNISICEEPV